MTALFQPHGDISIGIQIFIRACYGLLLIGTLMISLGPSRWFFISERYGGYAKSDRLTDSIQNPLLLPWILALWLLCGIMLVIDRYTVAFSLINLILCRYFFIQMRWKSILRGMGAPGFMTYWLGACVFFLEYGLHLDPSGVIRSSAITAFRFDFAVIMISAGVYKLVCGYPRNEGMELGMVNPWWGYWWRFYKTIPPHHAFFRSLNHMAYGTEIVAGVMMLIPATAVLGAWLIILSFLFIASQIRLGFLSEMVMVSGLIFMGPGSIADSFLQGWFTLPSLPTQLVPAPFHFISYGVNIFLMAYLLLLPVAHAGLWYNFLGRKSLAAPLQKLLERYTNLFGIIIWRVFTVDVINFFTEIYVEEKAGGARKQYARFGKWDWQGRFRYQHVGEFICLASVFTTLKYYPSNRALFEERLVRYARTIPCSRDSLIVFEYKSIRKQQSGFDYHPVAEYLVDVESGRVEVKVLDHDFSIRVESSPVHEARRPGSYAPAIAG